jgi:hypothetical protein
MAKFYWLAHRRTIADGRMRWHAETADEAFWADYWESKVNPAYYEGERFDRRPWLGRPLLAEMSRAAAIWAGRAGYWVAALRAAGTALSIRELGLVNRINRRCRCYGDATDCATTPTLLPVRR